MNVERERLWAGIALVVVAPVSLWGLFVAGMLLGASGGAVFMPALMFVIPSYVSYLLARVVFRRR